MQARPPSLTERVASELRDDILRGRYQAGDRLPSERELAERFDTHRGAVREALKKLEQLGIAEIRRGGARAAPIEQASLDVVRHLMELESPPDPQLFDQIFEVFGGLFSLAARLAAERADDDQRGRVAEILARLTDRAMPLADEHESIRELSDLFVESSQNMILRLVHRGLHTQIIERIENHQQLLRPPDSDRERLLGALAAAIANGDGDAASNAVYELSLAVRKHAVELLELERTRRVAAGRPEAAAGATRR
jgi:DNA-binding FadR family transcriptional regulator